MSVFHNNVLSGAAGQAGGAAAAAGPIKSVRFNSGDSAYLNRTPSSAGNRKKWTWAGWVKRSGSGANKALFGTDVSNNTVQLVYNSSDNLRFQVVVSGTNTFIDTDAVFRDFSGWYHVTLVFDSAQATAANRTKIYVNGAEQSVTGSFCAQNTDGIWNSANAMNIGQTGESSYEYYFDGYLADVYFIDGSALDPTSFGAFDDTASGRLQPIAEHLERTDFIFLTLPMKAGLAMIPAAMTMILR